MANLIQIIAECHHFKSYHRLRSYRSKARKINPPGNWHPTSDFAKSPFLLFLKLFSLNVLIQNQKMTKNEQNFTKIDPKSSKN